MALEAIQIDRYIFYDFFFLIVHYFYQQHIIWIHFTHFLFFSSFLDDKNT